MLGQRRRSCLSHGPIQLLALLSLYKPQSGKWEPMGDWKQRRKRKKKLPLVPTRVATHELFSLVPAALSFRFTLQSFLSRLSFIFPVDVVSINK